MMRKEIQKWIRGFVIILFGFHFVKSIIDLVVFEKKDLPITFRLPKDYDDLFDDENNDIKVLHVYNNKLRNSIAACWVKDSFPLVIYKMDIRPDKILDSIVEVHSEIKNIENDKLYYSILDSLIYPLQVKGVPENKIQKICLYFQGNTIQFFKKVNAIYYHSKVQSFALTFGKENYPELFFPDDSEYTNANKPFVEVNIFFIKKPYSLYMLLAVPSKKNKKVLQSQDMWNLLKK